MIEYDRQQRNDIMPVPKKTIFSLMVLATFAAVASAQDAAAPAPAVAAPAPSTDTPKGSAIIKVYSDLFYDFTDGATKTSGFDLTRAYLGYKEDFNDQLSGDVKFDVGRENFVTSVAGSATAVTTKTDARYNAFLKTAGLKWKNIVPMTTVEMGLVGTNMFDAIESFWQNRFVFPTFMDQNGFGSSADLGAKVAVKPIDILTLKAELLNGEGYKAAQDINGDYKGTFSAELKLPVGVQAVAYLDEMPVHGVETQMTYSGFLAYEMKDMFRIGAEYDYQVAAAGVKDHDWSGFSGNAAYTITKGVYLFARFDDLMSKSDWDKASKDGTRIIAGLDFDPVKNVKIAADFQGFQPAADGANYQPMGLINIQYAY